MITTICYRHGKETIHQTVCPLHQPTVFLDTFVCKGKIFRALPFNIDEALDRSQIMIQVEEVWPTDERLIVADAATAEPAGSLGYDGPVNERPHIDT